MRILVAEDDNFNQIVIEGMLTLLWPDTVVVIAQNGAEALAALQREAFDLVLSDVSMPVMDGKELVQRIKRDLPIQIPVIAVTAFAVVGDRERLLMVGFDDYISKPVVLEELGATIGRQMGIEVPQC